MPVTVKRIVLWRSEVNNSVGVLAHTLEPFAKAGADLQVMMAYRYPGNETRAAIELYPITGKKLTTAAQSVGLEASDIPTLLVEGDNRPGLAHAVAQAIAEAEINLAFFVAQVIGKRYCAVIGFPTDAGAKQAAALIKKATARGRK